MKRILALFLCGLICLSAAGCGKEEPFPSVATEPSVTQEPSTEPPETEPTEPPTEPDPDAPYRARAEEIPVSYTHLPSRTWPTASCW